MSDKFKLVGHETIPVEDLLEWGRWLQTADRKVAFDQLTPDVEVSTVFLGLDHNFGSGPPLLFETMIFGGEHSDYQERYSTWDEAEAGHKKAVELARRGALMSDSQRRKLHPMNDYTATHPRTRCTFVLENWGDYIVAEPLRFHLPDEVWKKFPSKATVRITVERVRPLTALERGMGASKMLRR